MSEADTKSAKPEKQISTEKTPKRNKAKRIAFSILAVIGAAAGILMRDMVYESVIYAAINMTSWLIAGTGCALCRKYTANVFARQALLILSFICLVELALVAYFLIQTAGWNNSAPIL